MLLLVFPTQNWKSFPGKSQMVSVIDLCYRFDGFFWNNLQLQEYFREAIDNAQTNEDVCVSVIFYLKISKKTLIYMVLFADSWFK